MSIFSPFRDSDKEATPIERKAYARLEPHHLEELLEHSPAAIGLMTGPEHRWAYVNQAYVQAAGRKSQAEFIGKTVRESMPEVEGQGFFELLDEVYRKGIPFVGTEMKVILNRAASGKLEDAYFNFVYQPTLNDSGQVAGILFHGVDVTHQVKARKAVEVSEERLRLAQEAAQIGTWEWDPVQDKHQLSPELHRLFGTHADDPERTQKWNSRVHPDDWDKVKQLMEKSSRTGSMEFEYRYLHPDLGLRCFYCKGARLRDETRLFGVVLDITERKHGEGALRESEERFRAIVDTTPECVKVVGPDGTLLHMNTAGLTMVGADCADMAIGKNIYDVIAPEDREKFRAFNERVCRGEKGNLEFDIVGLKGARLHMETHAAPLKRADGTTVQLAVTSDITERQRLEETLRQSEKEFRGLANAIPQLVWMAKDDGGIFWYNQRWFDYTGTTLKDMEGWGWQSVHDPAILPVVLERWKAAIADGDAFEMTFPLRGTDGRFRPFLTRVVPIRNQQGTIIRWFGTNTDIGVEVEARQQMQKNQESLGLALALSQRLAAIVESSEDAIASKDLNGVITSWNKSAERLFGYKAEEIIGRPVTTIIPPELLDDEPVILGKIRAGERIEHFQTVRLHKNGQRINVSLTVSPVRDDKGNIIAAAKIVRDISRQKKLEEAALRLAAIVESSDDAIASKDLNGIITSWNRSAEKLFGYKAEEIIGKPVTVIIPRELHHDEPMILSKIRRGEKIEHFETIRLHKSGERIEVSLTISPVKDEYGKVIGAAKIIRNITENNKIERALRTTEKLAAAGRMAATVAHEINNPLEAVTNLIYLAKRDLGDSDRVAGYLEMASRELDRVAHIARQTLGFYRDTSSPVLLNIAETLDDLLLLYEKRFGSRNIKVLKQYKGGTEITALGGEIRQAFSNLITNAVDAMPSGGKLVLRVSKSCERNNSRVPGVRVTILDTGCGIDPRHRNNIFQPFFTTKADVGTGLGLWITKSIVEKHGGAIHVKSKTGPDAHGTAFSIFLPLNYTVSSSPDTGPGVDEPANVTSPEKAIQ
jgi:PAS domain S-box-containing protein